MAESWASSEAVRRSMKSNRSRDTGPELRLRSELHRRGLRYFVDRAPIKGVRRRADVVFPRKKIAVFVDGCFWHGCPEHFTVAKTNAEYWAAKVEANRARDRDTDRLLIDAGWTVLRVWEHEDVEGAADRIVRAIRPGSER
ncbi:very short patch repair endonuclease [Gordonia neofelifaecis]|uniref:DNA mismatch endonuclease n=1 Tax=Gordonia neofelifaecis NRRL B-59395 TaxID=644548 RepID=F1YPS1_9ACTN|nr:DNA mismatch endonuclease [Gordonia neofelifaecis NRRL B-59395]